MMTRSPVMVSWKFRFFNVKASVVVIQSLLVAFLTCVVVVSLIPDLIDVRFSYTAECHLSDHIRTGPMLDN